MSEIMLQALTTIESEFKDLDPNYDLFVSNHLKNLMNPSNYYLVNEESTKKRFDELMAVYNDRLNNLRHQINVMKSRIDWMNDGVNKSSDTEKWNKLNFKMIEFGNQYNDCYDSLYR